MITEQTTVTVRISGLRCNIATIMQKHGIPLFIRHEQLQLLIFLIKKGSFHEASLLAQADSYYLYFIHLFI